MRDEAHILAAHAMPCLCRAHRLLSETRISNARAELRQTWCEEYSTCAVAGSRKIVRISSADLRSCASKAASSLLSASGCGVVGIAAAAADSPLSVLLEFDAVAEADAEFEFELEAMLASTAAETGGALLTQSCTSLRLARCASTQPLCAMEHQARVVS